MANTKTTPSAASKRANTKAAPMAQPEPTDVTPAPIPATVVDSPVSSPTPEKPQGVSPAVENPEVTSTQDETKKNKPLKLARTKAQKWLDNLKKAQESNPSKPLLSVISGIETLLAHEQNAASRANNRNLSGYNLFVQNNIKQVAAQNANLSNKEVMVKIAEMWQQHKANQATA